MDNFEPPKEIDPYEFSKLSEDKKVLLIEVLPAVTSTDIMNYLVFSKLILTLAPRLIYLGVIVWNWLYVNCYHCLNSQLMISISH